MIFKNLQRGIVALNKGHSQDFSFYGQSPSTNYATCYNDPTNLPRSSNATV